MLDAREKKAAVDGANGLEINIADLKVAYNAQWVVVERAELGIEEGP